MSEEYKELLDAIEDLLLSNMKRVHLLYAWGHLCGVYSTEEIGRRKLEAQLESIGSNYRKDKGMSLEEYKKGMNIHFKPYWLDAEPLCGDDSDE